MTSVMLRRAVIAAFVVASASVIARGDGPPAAAPEEARSTLVVCYPNAPGSTEAARPVMERLGAHLSARVGFEVAPIYTNDAAEAQRWIDERRPRFAILSLGLFLRWREALDLAVVAQSERHNAILERYHLVVAQDSPWRTLDDVKAGAPAPDRSRRGVIWSSHLDDPRFVSRVVLGGALTITPDEAGDARGVVTAQPLRAIRRMKSGEPFEGAPVDAVLLEDAAWTELQKIQSFREGLRALHVSQPLPTPVVVTFGDVPAADVERLRQALVSMHEHADGRELLTTLQCTGFAAPAPAAIEAAIEAYREGP
jgi:ABC-type phosphate/phosphonate transport system substrate-binding protein